MTDKLTITPLAALETAVREAFPGLKSPAGMADMLMCELEKQGFTVERVRWTSFVIADLAQP